MKKNSRRGVLIAMGRIGKKRAKKMHKAARTHTRRSHR